MKYSCRVNIMNDYMTQAFKMEKWLVSNIGEKRHNWDWVWGLSYIQERTRIDSVIVRFNNTEDLVAFRLRFSE